MVDDYRDLRGKFPSNWYLIGINRVFIAVIKWTKWVDLKKMVRNVESRNYDKTKWMNCGVDVTIAAPKTRKKWLFVQTHDLIDMIVFKTIFYELKLFLN